MNILIIDGINLNFTVFLLKSSAVAFNFDAAEESLFFAF
jgi:hypothetical protein